jgi:hypothetical protein
MLLGDVRFTASNAGTERRARATSLAAHCRLANLLVGSSFISFALPHPTSLSHFHQRMHTVTLLTSDKDEKLAATAGESIKLSVKLQSPAAKTAAISPAADHDDPFVDSPALKKTMQVVYGPPLPPDYDMTQKNDVNLKTKVTQTVVEASSASTIDEDIAPAAKKAWAVITEK